MAVNPTTQGEMNAPPPPPAGEVNIDGNTFSSDGGGNMSFDVDDGSHG